MQTFYVQFCEQQENAIQTMELRNYFSLFCLHQETQLVFTYLPVTSHILGAFVNSQVQGHREVGPPPPQAHLYNGPLTNTMTGVMILWPRIEIQCSLMQTCPFLFQYRTWFNPALQRRWRALFLFRWEKCGTSSSQNSGVCLVKMGQNLWFETWRHRRNKKHCHTTHAGKYTALWA